MKKILFILVLLAASQNAFAMSEEERVEDANTIINLFAQQYAPLKWKEELLGLDFASVSAKYIEEAKNAASDKDFYRATALFLSSFNDAHVSYRIPSSLVSFLPLGVEYFSDGVIITYVNREILPEDKFPIEAGDRLVKMDGRSVEEIVEELSVYSNTGHDITTRKLVGSNNLTYRAQLRFPDVPRGPVTLTIISKKSGAELNIETEWITKGASLAEMPPKSAAAYMAQGLSAYEPNEQHGSAFLDKAGPLDGYIAGSIMGKQLPFFPLWEDFVFRTKIPYIIGTFMSGGKRIGYIRVPSWEASFQTLPMLAKEIEYLNNNTDALIIDQTNNGGGSICYTEAVASLFITEPKDELRFQLRANRNLLSMLEEWFASSEEAEKAHASSWLSSMRTAVLSGELLTQPQPLCSFTGKILPVKNERKMPIVYIKPVLILVNELDFSAADMFPIIMKEWGRAALFGTRTVGAGGHRVIAEFVGNSELEIRITQSLAYRENAVMLENGISTHYIENVGVSPDIAYEITSKDYYDDYASYKKAVESAVLSLIDGK